MSRRAPQVPQVFQIGELEMHLAPRSVNFAAKGSRTMTLILKPETQDEAQNLEDLLRMAAHHVEKLGKGLR